MTRHFWVLIHRYAGLFMAFFLIVAGLTGSILAFDGEINGWLNPPQRVEVRERPMLDPFDLRERALALVPQGRINAISFQRKPGEASVLRVEPREDPATGQPYDLAFNTLTLDPYTGAEIERVKTPDGFWPLTRQNVIPFIVALHYRLAVPGSIGTWLFGIAAVIWTVDCFIGFYLTLPSWTRAKTDSTASPVSVRHSWWLRWLPSWSVKWRGSPYRLNFDLHRASGLWTWVMLFVLAWSSVAFNLGPQVYTPVMKVLFDMQDPYGDRPTVQSPQPDPPLDWREAHEIGRQFMAEQAGVRGYTVLREDALSYDPEKGLFFYGVRSDHDVSDEGGGTMVMFDARTGEFAGQILPSGQDAGTTITNWILILHMAAIWGAPFKIFVCVMGVVVAMLSITGVYLWLKKRRSRAVAQTRRTIPATVSHA
ncbi:MAG: PepSY-associated TM helix domain-containing protein [Nitrospirae bacterium]|nr:PepSY-associated TM helix domain-containing protein [Nitrospirota bacterium]